MKRMVLRLLALAPLLLAACSDATLSFTDAPPGHTLRLDGVWHAPGLTDPTARCTECHGADLRGEGEAPSCFRCHGAVWR